MDKTVTDTVTKGQAIAAASKESAAPTSPLRPIASVPLKKGKAKPGAPGSVRKEKLSSKLDSSSSSEISGKVDETIMFIKDQLGQFRQGENGLWRAVGKHVVDNYCHGDLDYTANRNPRKPDALNKAFKQLEEKGCDMKRSTMLQCVELLRQDRVLPKEVADRLSKTHFVALLSVKDTDEKAKLAVDAVDNNWSSSELRKKIEAQSQSAVQQDVAQDGSEILQAVAEKLKVIEKQAQAVAVLAVNAKNLPKAANLGARAQKVLATIDDVWGHIDVVYKWAEFLVP